MACSQLSEPELARVLAEIQARADVDRSTATGGAPSEADEALIEILALQREYGEATVRTCTSFRVPSLAQYVVIEEMRLAGSQATCRVVFRHSRRYTENESHDDEAWVRGIADRYRTF